MSYDSDTKFVAVMGGVSLVLLAGWVLAQKRRLYGKDPEGSSKIAPITITAQLTPEGLLVDAFDRKWLFSDYGDFNAWGSAAIEEIDQFMSPDGTLIVYRPDESYREVTDALKAARSDLGNASAWILSLRDLEDVI